MNARAGGVFPQFAALMGEVVAFGAPRGVPRRSVALTACRSSVCLGRIVGAMFMRVNAICAHQVRPPLARVLERNGFGSGGVPARLPRRRTPCHVRSLKAARL